MDFRNKFFKNFTFLMSLVPIIILISIVIFLFSYSINSIIYNGFGFFQSFTWNPGKGEYTLPPIVVHGVPVLQDATYGALSFLFGTVLTSLLAILIALPVSFFIAITLHFYMPVKTRGFLSSLVELFAGIPSVVYGFWGFLYLTPILGKAIEPWMSANLSQIPVIGRIFAGEVLYGYGIIASAIILGIMIIPIITAVMTNSIKSTPKDITGGVTSLGATNWELGKYLLLSHSRSSTAGGTLLGLGRALGETMAVLMVSGGLDGGLPSSLYSTINTMAAAIAAKLAGYKFDTTGMYLSALSELALVLMGVTLLASVLGRKIAGRGVLRGYEND